MEELETLKKITSPEEYEAALALGRQNAVHFLAEEETRPTYSVGREDARIVRLFSGETLGGTCTCGYEDGICRHVAAALTDALTSGKLTLARRHRCEENSRRLREAENILLPRETALILEPTVILPEEGGKGLGIALRTGQDRLYVVRSISQFFSALDDGSEVSFGKNFAVTPTWKSYSREDRDLLNILSDIALVMTLSGQLARTGAAARLLPVPERFVPRLLSILSGRRFRVRVDGREYRMNGIPDGRLDMLFAMTLHGREIEVRAQYPEKLRRVGREAVYAFCDGELIRLPREQRAVLTAMPESRALFCFPPEETMWALCELLPQLQQAGHVVLEGRLKDRLIMRPLKTDVRLDRDDAMVLCEVEFHYGNSSVDPFRSAGQGAEEDGLLLVRDVQGERQIIDMLASFGFRMGEGRAVLRGSENLWNFFTEGLDRLSSVASVWLSEAFRSMKPRRPAMSGRIGVQGSGLRLELNIDGEPAEDAEDILRALRERRHWFRLKSGAFLDLTGLTEWEDVADAALEQEPTAADLVPQERGILEIRAYRASYLLSLVKGGGAKISVDGEVTRKYAENSENDGESPLGEMLRPYQERGFAWLRSLYRMNLGGILADDMGLGKTVQIIALILWSIENEKEKLPTIIVAPTSLVYNWATEISRFAKKLSVMIADGTQAAREGQIARLTGEDAPDVYLTSYPLMRRDITSLSKVHFRFAILDEAQYIKNAASVGAGAARQLTAGTRFALTGTPMENHPGELWSLFDFVLPGYLGTFSAFMQRFGLGGDAEKLRGRIRPFLLRRLKEDVLTELPEKTEEVLVAEMTPEQDRVYRAALQRLRPEERQFSGGARFRVLAALTELRECCDHPQLILPDYAGGSGKMELLMDVLPGALASGRRVLLFSQFTRMLRILERRLTASGVECFYLDGETPARTRMEMVNQFNAGEGQVFLISLKAGGSGLNLTGADWVIHYDPWWNPAAEDQATDRAHRIGQSKAVTVTRLITHGTVEEQVALLSSRKREIFDRMIEAGETFPTQLTDEEIRGLFDEG